VSEMRYLKGLTKENVIIPLVKNTRKCLCVNVPKIHSCNKIRGTQKIQFI
jgi:hypothetical protein